MLKFNFMDCIVYETKPLVVIHILSILPEYNNKFLIYVHIRVDYWKENKRVKYSYKFYHDLTSPYKHAHQKLITSSTRAFF